MSTDKKAPAKSTGGATKKTEQQPAKTQTGKGGTQKTQTGSKTQK